MEICLKHTNHENLNKYFFQGAIISKFISIEPSPTIIFYIGGWGTISCFDLFKRRL